MDHELGFAKSHDTRNFEDETLLTASSGNRTHGATATPRVAMVDSAQSHGHACVAMGTPAELPDDAAGLRARTRVL